MLFGADAISAYRVSCYYSNWARYRPDAGAFTPANVPGDLCTHVVYAFIGVNWEWKVGILDSWSDVDLHGFEEIVALKQSHPGIKTTVAVGGWNEGGSKYSEMVADRSKSATFIASVVDFLNQYGFDGLDIDWEYPGDSERGGHPEDKANFVTFVQELRQAFDAQGKGWEITMAVSVGAEKIDNGYDVPALCAVIDGIHAMAYDLRGSWDTFIDPHSLLNKHDNDEGAYAQLNVRDGIGAWTSRGCPANKIIVGVPLYGKSFAVQQFELHSPHQGNGEAGPYTRAAGTLAYYEICAYVNNGWTEMWDEQGQVPYAHNGNTWVGYENPRSIQIKAEWIREQGFQGAMVWAIDLDDFQGTCGSKYPLTSILHSTLKNAENEV